MTFTPRKLKKKEMMEDCDSVTRKFEQNKREKKLNVTKCFVQIPCGLVRIFQRTFEDTIVDFNLAQKIIQSK